MTPVLSFFALHLTENIMATAPITICKEHYKRVGLIGKGAGGKVFKLEKKPEYADTNEPQFLARKVCCGSDREAEIMKNMPPHENVLRCYDYVVEDSLEIFMELCDTDLKTYMKENRIDVSNDPEKIISLSKQLMAGLAHIHGHKVFHRDLKPENVLIKTTEDGITLKIADFGSSKLLKADQTQNLTIGGTGRYMSPEMLEAALNPSSATAELSPMPSDIYSMGLLILYLVIDDVRPFRHDKTKTCLMIQKHLPDSLLTPVLQLMLAEKPRDRANATVIHDILSKTLVSFRKCLLFTS